MRKLQLALIIALPAAVGIWSAVFAYQWYLLDIQTAPIQYQVVEGAHLGFNIDPGKLAFGKVPQGGGAERKATLQTRVRATAIIQTDLPTVQPNATRILLEPDQPQQVLFTLTVPENATPGNYTGTVKVIYTRRFR